MYIYIWVYTYVYICVCIFRSFLYRQRSICCSSMALSGFRVEDIAECARSLFLKREFPTGAECIKLTTAQADALDPEDELGEHIWPDWPEDAIGCYHICRGTVSFGYFSFRLPSLSDSDDSDASDSDVGSKMWASTAETWVHETGEEEEEEDLSAQEETDEETLDAPAWGATRSSHIKGITFDRKGGTGRTIGWNLRWTDASASSSKGCRKRINKFFFIGTLPRNISPKSEEERQWLEEHAGRDKKCFNDAVQKRAQLESSGQACLAGRPGAAGTITFSHQPSKRWLKKKPAAMLKRPATSSYAAAVLRHE